MNDTTRNALANAFDDQVGGTGSIQVRDASGNVIVTWTLSATTFSDAAVGVITLTGTESALKITSDTCASGADAAVAVLLDSAGNSVATFGCNESSKADVNFSNKSIAQGETVNLNTCTVTVEAGSQLT